MEPAPDGVFRFGEYEVDARSGELRKYGTKVRLSDQPFQILLMLVEHPGDAVLRDEIRKRLWPDDTIVEFDHSINVAVKRLRDSLGDSAESPRYVETLGRRGYRFVAQVERFQRQPHQPAQESPLALNVSIPADPVPGSILRVSSSIASKRRWLAVSAACVAIVSLAVGALRLVPRHKKALTDKDTIILADFANTTGDPVFDGTLRQGLAVQLEQSPFLSLISEPRIQQTLRLMEQPADAKLTLEIGRDLCQRTGSAAVIDGSIAKLGSQYVLGLEAVNCQSGDFLAREQQTAETKERILNVLGDAAARLRAKLGESLSTVRKYDTPLEEATTVSLEALQAYSLGKKILIRGTDAEGVPAIQRAIRLDPNFAMAYALLGDLDWNLGEEDLAAENVRRAYELRERVSDRERFFIESEYNAKVTGDREAALRVYQLWAQTYPRDYNRNDLGSLYNELGEHEKALAVKLEALRLDPENPSRYPAVGDSLLSLNRFEEARAIAKEAQAKNLDSLELHSLLYQLAFFENNAAGMAKHVAWLAGKPEEFSILDREASTEAYFGRLGKSREFSRRAVNVAELGGLKGLAARLENAAAIREAVFGNRVQARERVQAHGGRDSAGTALALALAGETGRAQSLANELARRSPENTEVRFSYVPTIHAQLALDQGHPEKAIEDLQIVRPYELGAMGFSTFPIYVRGGAYLAAKRGAEAATEFQKILDYRGLGGNDPINALAHLQLGRAFALSGNHTKAKAAYRDFLTLWKDADPDIPVLKDAKAEYAKLQ